MNKNKIYKKKNIFVLYVSAVRPNCSPCCGTVRDWSKYVHITKTRCSRDKDSQHFFQSVRFKGKATEDFPVAQTGVAFYWSCSFQFQTMYSIILLQYRALLCRIYVYNSTYIYCCCCFTRVSDPENEF
jgi:hypothetical protein